ncbi:MAG: SpoIID/LytB domain-containing protein [Solirubrobacteraceae bacterium]
MGWLRAILLAVGVALIGAQGAQAGVLVIDGAGDGHGVGMSQTGAEGLALHGYDARQILTHYYTGTTVGRIAPGHLLTVLLQSQLRAVVFSDAARAGTRPLDPAHTYIATPGPNGQIALLSEHGRLLSYLPAPLAVTSAVPIAFDGAASSGVINGRYRGSLSLVLDRGRLNVINRVGLEAYLRGVVSAESPSNWAPAELEAQAIAARSYAVASPPDGSFDLYADTRSQQYGGYDAETAATNAAVEATTDEVVTYAGHPVVTYYFAASGGATEDVQNGLPGTAPKPWLVGVLDPYDATRFGPITMTLTQADRRLRGLLRGVLRSIVVTARGVSPRIVSAELVGSAGTTTVNGVELAAALGLQSTWDCFAVSTSMATIAAGWDRACAKPTRLSVLPHGATGLTGYTGPPLGSTVGGTVAPAGATGTTGTTQAASGSSGATGSHVGGAVGPPG